MKTRSEVLARPLVVGCARLGAPLVLVLALLSAELGAQVAWIYRGTAATPTAMPALPSPCPFAPLGPAITPPGLVPGTAPAGGLAFDESTSLVAFSTGATIAVLPHPFLPPAGVAPPPGAFPVPAVPCPASPGGVFGTVTGMAAGFVPLFGTILWVTDGRCIMGLSMTPPFAVVRPPFAVAAAAGAAPPLSGLEVDTLSASLWACNTAGSCFNVRTFPAGPAAGGAPQAGSTIAGPFDPLLAPSGSVVGCIVERSAPGLSLRVTDGAFLYPVLGGAASAVPVAAGAGTAYGATFSAEPLALASGGACIGTVPTLTVSRAASWGGVLPFAVMITDGFAGAPALLALDLACTPSGTPLPGAFGGGTWWLTLAPPLLIGPFALGPGGDAVFPFPVTADFVGVRVLAQAATVCALTGAVAATRALSITIASP